jgi:hypothetical protein
LISCDVASKEDIYIVSSAAIAFLPETKSKPYLSPATLVAMEAAAQRAFLA